MGHAENENDSAEQTLKMPTEIYQNALEEIVRKNCNAAYGDSEVKIEAGSAKGDNYIGVVYRIKVKPPKGETLNIIAKLPPQNIARREQFFARPCFLRESEFYDVIYPMYAKFQVEKGIDVEKDGFSQKAKCYKSLTTDLNEGLFFEDLKASGFDMFDRFKEVTKDHVLRVMEALAKFHAISYALKDQRPELIEPYKTMEDIFFQRDEESMEQIKVWFEHLKKQAYEALDLMDNDDLKERARRELEKDFFTSVGETIDGEAAEPYTVICHGDCWNNNIMYRYQNGIPTDVRLLDWQIMRYSSPVCDLVYYIFGCTVKSLRDKHYKEFLDCYHSNLTNFLRRLGSNPEKIFPRSAFDDQLKRFGKFGLAMAIMVLPIFTSKVEDIPDMDEMAENFQKSKENGTKINPETMSFTSSETLQAYNKRMCDVFQDMYDLNYI